MPFAAAPPQSLVPAREARTARGYKAAFWILLAGFELWLATLPLIPNGDGPMHIYLASTFWKLATHSSPFFEHFYTIRHLVQPYSFHYYLLILLERVMRPDGAEKVFAGLILATTAFGFRALARALDARSAAAPLLVFPLLLSWPLSAGFFNFTFGCGLLLFALALYTRLHAPALNVFQRHGRTLGVFTLVLALLVLAHPIPIMILICLIGLDLALQLPGRLGSRPLLPPAQAAALGLSCLAFLFPILIADKAAVAQSVSQIGFRLYLLEAMLAGYRVSYFQVRNPLGVLYEASITAILPVSLFLIFVRLRAARRSRSFSAADRLLAAALLYLAATLLFPDSMNGSAYFAMRMWYPVGLLAAAAIAARVQPGAAERWAAGWSLGTAALTLAFAFLYVPPVARAQAELEQAPLPPHARGLYLLPTSGVAGSLTHTWWGVNFWSGVRAFNAHGDVLVNTPWMELSILPVSENGRAGLLRDFAPGKESEAPYRAVELMSGTPASAAALRLADFVLASDPNGRPPAPEALARKFMGAESSQWRCTSHGAYAICERR